MTSAPKRGREKKAEPLFMKLKACERMVEKKKGNWREREPERRNARTRKRVGKPAVLSTPSIVSIEQIWSPLGVGGK